MVSENQKIINEIVEYYQKFAENRMNAIKAYMKERNLYGAEKVANDLTLGLAKGGDYLLHPKQWVRRNG